MDHTITIATRQAPIDTLELPTMGTLYRWECSCDEAGLTWKSTESAARQGADFHCDVARANAIQAIRRHAQAVLDTLGPVDPEDNYYLAEAVHHLTRALTEGR
jgi:hypothetical protein